VEMLSNHSQDRGSGMQVTTYGVDLAKRAFQAHWVEPGTGEVKRKMIMGNHVLSLRVGMRVWWRWRPAVRPTIGDERCVLWGTRCDLIPTQFVRRHSGDRPPTGKLQLPA
jgi:hypothetical protein